MLLPPRMVSKAKFRRLAAAFSKKDLPQLPGKRIGLVDPDLAVDGQDFFRGFVGIEIIGLASAKHGPRRRCFCRRH